MKISQLSKSLDVPVPTLRRWTLEFAAGLSPEARGANGRARVFSARDIRLLRRAKELLAEEDATYAGVRQRLVSERLLPPGRDSSSEATANEAAANTPTPEEERAAAERFVRLAAEPLVAQAVADLRRQYDERLQVLERDLAEVRAELARLRRDPARTTTEATDRRRWPFG